MSANIFIEMLAEGSTAEGKRRTATGKGNTVTLYGGAWNADQRPIMHRTVLYNIKL